MEIALKIQGETSLIMHKWSKKAMQEMLDAQMGKKKKVREMRDPDRDMWESIYHFNAEQEAHLGHRAGNRYGFPAVAFKNAMVTAVTSVSQMTKVQARQCFYIVSDFGDLVEIHGVPYARTDMVRVGMGAADLRFRGEFPDWYANLRIRFNADVISMESLLHLLNLAGFGVGIGEWRSEKDGIYGAFRVDESAEVAINPESEDKAA